MTGCSLILNMYIQLLCHCCYTHICFDFDSTHHFVDHVNKLYIHDQNKLVKFNKKKSIVITVVAITACSITLQCACKYHCC